MSLKMGLGVICSEALSRMATQYTSISMDSCLSHFMPKYVLFLANLRSEPNFSPSLDLWLYLCFYFYQLIMFVLHKNTDSDCFSTKMYGMPIISVTTVIIMSIDSGLRYLSYMSQICLNYSSFIGSLGCLRSA